MLMKSNICAKFYFVMLFCLLIIMNLIRKTMQTTNPLFVTTLADIETSRWILSLTNPTAVNGLRSESLTLNYINAYTTGTPSVALSFDFINGNYLSTTAYRETVLDLSQTSVSGSSVTILLTRTDNFLISMAINYIVVKSGFIMDIRNQLIDLSSTTVWLGNSGTRTFDMTVNYRGKSNATNTVLIYATAGIFMGRTSNSFQYTLNDIGKLPTSYSLRISVMSNNKVRWIRISTINYESVAATVDPPFYLEMGFFSSLSATVPDSSGIGVSSMGTIFSGMTDLLVIDSNNVFDYNMSSTGRIFTLVTNSISRSKTCYFWYRQESCLDRTYLKDHLCEDCHHSCLTCFDATSTSCLTCITNRTHNNSVKSCPCNAGFVDVGVPACQQITCSYACQTCAAMNQCGSCTSSFNRVLVGTECQCKNYFYDDGASAPCPPCHISCKTCTAMYSPVTCSACVTTDNRIYRQSNHTCECQAGYFQNYTSACPKCHYSCATCNKNTECLTCNLALGRQPDSSTKLCRCIAGNYDDLLEKCAPCPYYCLTCNATACLSCASPRIQNTTSGYCECEQKFYDDGVNTACQACKYYCADCDNSSECSLCNLGMQRTLDPLTKQCNCLDGFFDNPPNEECGSCDKSCATCSGGSNTQCKSCNNSAFRSLSLTNECVCAQGYFQVVNQQLCLACSHSCKTCVSSPDCTSCDSTKFRQPSGNICGCMTGYYDDGNQLCEKCYYRCLTCTNSITCTTCDSATRDISNLATCICKQGFYDDGISSSCLSCQVQCLACSNGNNCTTCPVNKNLTINRDCECAPATYEPNCLKCAKQCQQCVDTANKCTLCNGAFHRYFESANNTCPCYDGYFDNGADQICSSCHYSCNTCSDFTQCDSCPSNRVINGSVCSCKPQYFQDASNKNCINCHYSCKLCSSTSVCSECDSTKFRQIRAGSTLCLCMAGYYDDGNSQVCYRCQYDCKTCSSYSHCLTCQSGLNRHIFANSCPCLDGFYEDSSFLCQACDQSCETCLKPNQCVLCKTGRSLSSITKLCQCNTGTFDNPSTRACDNCGYPCQQCSQSSINCTKCQAGRLLTNFRCPCLVTTFDNGTACENCLNTCATCTQNGQCDTCKTTLNRNLNAGICTCITGYHDNNGALLICEQCHYSCQTCISSTICSVCANGRIATGGLCSCPANRFYDVTNLPTCQACHYSCLKCSSSPQNCQECLPIHHRTHVSGNKTCPCDIKYYDDGSSPICKDCHYTCAKCSSASTCSLCDSTKFRQYVSGPFCNCLPGYYDVSAQLCSPCNYKCRTCEISSTKCLSCVATRIWDSGTNTCPCRQGYFDNLVSTCATCLYSCLTCATNYDCQTCDTTTRQLSSSKQCICKDGFYNINGIKACAPCDQTCLTCSSFSICTSCDTQTTGRVLNANDCLCQIGFYSDSDNGEYICQKCDYTCEYCESSSKCTSCNSLAERTLDTLTKLCKCNNGFYDDTFNMGCLACPFDCQTCSGPSTCILCASQRIINGTTNRCDCGSSYYQNGTTCQLCPPECATCTDLNTCQSCNGIRTISNNKCVCPQGQYPQPASANCIPCHYSCQSCNSPSQCLTCNASVNQRFLSGVYCACLNGYYDIPSIALCATCHYSCRTCTVGNRCTTCHTSAQRVYNSGTLLCSCSSGFFEDPVTKSCIKCHHSCTSCSNGSACTGCNSLHLRSLSATFQCNCPSINFYDDGTNSQCAMCSPYCLSCSTLSTNCTACITISPAYRSLNVDQCLCKTGYFQLNSQVNCMPCNYQCVTCSIAADKCTLCSSAHNRQIGTQTCACLNGFYDDGSNALCKTCDFRCLTCKDGSTCQTCNSDNKRELSQTTKLCQCQINHYQTNMVACGQCFYTCASCNHGSLCLSCPSTRTYNTGVCPCNKKYYDDGSSLLCQSCHYSCNECTNSTQCLVCSSNHFRQYNSNTKYCTCLVGYYQQNSEQLCIKCESSCATCTNGTHCETCPTNINKTLNAVSGSNYCVCLDHYYADVFTIVNNHIACKPCHYSCQTCQNQAHFCKSCDSNSHRTINSQQQCLCDITYYDDGSGEMCLQCYVGCLTCWGSAINQCLTCSDSTFMLNNTCYSTCPDYYYNNVKVCSACPPYCLQCTNSTYCDLCQNDFYILSVAAGQMKCYDTCPKFYYSNNTHCLKCIAPCLTCSDKFVCTDCIPKHYLQIQCQPCFNLCQSCTGGSANQCVSCADPEKYYIQNGRCVKITCASNQYVHPTLGCQNCSDTFPKALQCSSKGVIKCQQGFKVESGQCFSCANVIGYNLINGVCQQICGDGLVFQAKCDDNNTLNGDGCSSLCMVEEGWECLTPSICQIAVIPSIKADSIVKVKNANKIHIVLVLNIGLRLIKQNIVLKFSAGQSYNHTLFAINPMMTRYKLQIEYFDSIMNSALNIKVVSPPPSSRLLFNNSNQQKQVLDQRRLLIDLSIQNQISVDIDLSLDLNLTVSTNPPSTYISPQTRSSYGLGLLIFLGVLRAVFLIVLVVVVALRLKVMLHVIDSIKMMSLLYLLGSFGMHSVSSLTQSYIVVLRPFIYPFGQPFPDSLSDISPVQAAFTKLVISSFLIQFLIILFLSLWQMIKPSASVNYFKTSFIFALTYDLLISSVIVFSWVGIQSYGDAFSWAFALVTTLLVASQSGFYYNLAQQFHKKGRMIVPGISNATAQKDNQLNDQEKRVDQFIDYRIEADSDMTQPLPIANKAHDKKFDTVQNHYRSRNELEELYDLAPSQVISPTYLPVYSFVIPFLFCIVFMIQSSIVRLSLLTALSIVSFVFNVIKLPLKNYRTVKVLIFQFICFLIAIVGLVGSIISISSSNSLYFVEPTIATLVVIGVIFNLITIMIAVYKSDSLTQFIVSRKNQSIINKNTVRNNRGTIKNIFHKKIEFGEGQIEDSENNQLDQTGVNKSIEKRHYQKVRDSRKMTKDSPLGNDTSFLSRDPFAKQGTEILNLEQLGIGYNVLKKQMDLPQNSKGSPSKKRRMNSSDDEEIFMNFNTNKQLMPSQSETSLISQKQLFQRKKKSPQKYKIKKTLDAMRDTGIDNMPVGIKARQSPEWQADEQNNKKFARMDSISSIEQQRKHFRKQQNEGQAMTVFKKILNDYQQSKNTKSKKGLIRNIKK